jgi:hypothetical protein
MKVDFVLLMNKRLTEEYLYTSFAVKFSQQIINYKLRFNN